MNNTISRRRKYLLFLSIGILSFYISGFLLGILSETYGIGIHGLEAVSFMLFTYVILLAAGLIFSIERSFGFILKAFALSFAAMFLISAAFFAWGAYEEVNMNGSESSIFLIKKE